MVYLLVERNNTEALFHKYFLFVLFICIGSLSSEEAYSL